MTWTIEQATATDAHRIAPHMTPADAAEVWASGRRTPLEALLQSLRLSLQSWTWHVDGEPACMFGVATPSLLGEIGSPWLLSTPLVKRHTFAFLRNYRGQINRILDIYPVLMNYVDARHTVCIRWLKWTGFTVYDPEPFGPDGAPFCRFEIRK